MWNIEVFDILPSTMDTAHERAKSHTSENPVIVAREQSGARGRRGNVWIAPPGNLYCSIIIKPQTDIKDVGQYSFIAAVALADIVKPLLDKEFTYQHKWPNDGLINDRKFAGFLIEGGINEVKERYLVLGIGVNIVSAPPEKACLAEAGAVGFSSDELLKLYLQKLDEYLEFYRNKGFKPIRDAWIKDAKGLNQDITVRLPHETLQGVFNGLDETGALLLKLDKGGEKVIHSGEVFFGKDI